MQEKMELQYNETDYTGITRELVIRRDSTDINIYQFMSDFVYPMLTSIGYSHDLINKVFDINEMYDRGLMD